MSQCVAFRQSQICVKEGVRSLARCIGTSDPDRGQARYPMCRRRDADTARSLNASSRRLLGPLVWGGYDGGVERRPHRLMTLLQQCSTARRAGRASAVARAACPRGARGRPAGESSECGRPRSRATAVTGTRQSLCHGPRPLKPAEIGCKIARGERLLHVPPCHIQQTLEPLFRQDRQRNT
jgi:hypothetical protein